MTPQPAADPTADQVEQQRGVFAAITLTAIAEVIPGEPDEPQDLEEQ